ncbi:uncharacterized protein [Choristoneura fumiferana]|uniref:uncharacterized protein n=1 Tax=Choristoneura fumiferana TaxID=7141 RepID=UPI003D157F5A
MKLSTVEQKNICRFLPKIKSDEIIQHILKRKIMLTDTTDSPDYVQLLIGADFSSLLLTGEFVHICGTYERRLNVTKNTIDDLFRSDKGLKAMTTTRSGRVVRPPNKN